MIRWHNIYAHRWYYGRGDSIQSYLPYPGTGHPLIVVRAHINSTYTLGRLLEAIR